MSLKAYNIDVPITPGVMPPVIHIGQYDSGRDYICHLKNDDGTDYIIPSGTTATFTGCNPRKEVFELEATVDPGANTIRINPQGAATSMWGKYGATLNLDNYGEKMSPIVLLMDVQKAGATDEEIAGAANFPDAVTEAVDNFLTEALEEGDLGSLYVTKAAQTPATEEMTQPVGITPEGLLVTTPGGGGGGGSGTVNPVGMGFAYSTSSTAQATSPKTTGTVSGFALKQYAIVVVRFSNPVNSGQKLNFSGTGAKDIYFRNSAIGPGIIEAGDTVAFQYDGTRYRIISIDKAPVSQTDDSNYFVHLTASPGGGGDMLTDRTASDIYTALSANTDLNFILIDGSGRQAHFTKKPTSANDSAQFTLVANGNQITYTLPTNGGNTVAITTESIIGGGGTATWESILPAGGIRQTDIAKLTVTFTQQGNGYTASSNLTQVLAALNDNKAVECKLGDHIGDLVYVHEDSEDTSASFAIFRMTGMIAAFQNQENEERFPAILMLYMTHVGVSYKEFAIGGSCYCYVTESGGVYDIDQANTSLAAQTIPGLLTAYYAGIETQMIVYDGYQRWTYPVISHYGQAEIAFGGLEQVIENGNVVSYLVSYTFSAQNAHIIRNRRRAAGGMDVPAPGTGDNGKVWMAGANGTASWQTPSGGGGGSTPETVNLTMTVGQSSTELSVALGYSALSAKIAAGARLVSSLTLGYESISLEWHVIGANSTQESISLYAVLEDSNGQNLLVAYLLENQTNIMSGTVESQPIGNAKNPTVVTKSGASPSAFSLADNTIYECGELTALTISSATATGTTVVTFTSGATATTASFPANVLFSDDQPDVTNGVFVPSANYTYEINIRNRKALISRWAVSA